jgi:hypothetical protein
MEVPIFVKRASVSPKPRRQLGWGLRLPFEPSFDGAKDGVPAYVLLTDLVRAVEQIVQGGHREFQLVGRCGPHRRALSDGRAQAP